MAIKKYKPTSNGRRGMTVLDFSEITTDQPEKSLLAPLKKKQAATTKGKLPFAIKAGVISVNTGSSTLSVTKMEFQDALLRLSTIRTARRTSRSSTMQTVKNGTSSRRKT